MKLFFLTSLSSILLFCSFGFAEKQVKVIESSSDEYNVPSDFGKEGNTLLCVLAGNRMSNRKTKRKVKKKYKGKYLFISEDDLKKEIYSDKDEYRYALKSVISYHISTSRSSAGSTTGTNITVKLTLIDRKNNKKYKFNKGTSTPAILVSEYMTNLENIRKKNSQ